MPVYDNRQGDGLFIALKYRNGVLDTGSYTGGYAHKPAARVYNTAGKAKAQWSRFIKDGYDSRAAELRVNSDGSIEAVWIDEKWTPNVALCKHSRYGKTCKLLKGHEGIHQ